MLAAPALGIALVAVFMASIITGLVSFGVGMVLSPILLLMLEPQSVVTIINSVSVIVLAMVTLQTRRDIPPKQDMLPLIVSGLVAVPVGVLILSSASPGSLRIIIASLILILAIPSTLRIQRPFPNTNRVSPIFGFVGSMLLAGTGVGPPLVALFLVNQGWSGRSIRATIAFYYLIIASFSIILYAVTGLFTLERVWQVLPLIPAVFAGFGLASLIVHRINDRVLRRVVLAVIIVASATLLGRELLG